LALPILSTNDRIRLVYTGDPSLADPKELPGKYKWRTATPDDAQKGASVAVIRALNKTESITASRKAAGDSEALLCEMLAIGFLGFDGDPRPTEVQIETMPRTARLTLAQAIDSASSDTRDPFGQRSSG
jgi:hypothetical protein